jgi:excisionase family DNA binding protein
MARLNTNATLLNVQEVSRLLNVHINTVRRWSDQGLLRAYRIGSRGDRRYDRADIAAFLVAQSARSRLQ